MDAARAREIAEGFKPTPLWRRRLNRARAAVKRAASRVRFLWKYRNVDWNEVRRRNFCGAAASKTLGEISQAQVSGMFE